jgi:hypothetical protein
MCFSFGREGRCQQANNSSAEFVIVLRVEVAPNVIGQV